MEIKLEGKRIPPDCKNYACLDILKKTYIDSLNELGYKEYIEGLREVIDTLKVYFVFKSENPRPEQIEKVLEFLEGSGYYKRSLHTESLNNVTHQEDRGIIEYFVNKGIIRHLNRLEIISKSLKEDESLKERKT